MKKYINLFVSFFIFGLVACEYDYIAENNLQPKPDPDNPISFTSQIEPVFQSKCIACHSSRTAVLTVGKAFNNIKNYIDIEKPDDSEIYKKSTDAHGQNMNSDESLILLTWIIEGAKDN